MKTLSVLAFSLMAATLTCTSAGAGGGASEVGNGKASPHAPAPAPARNTPPKAGKAAITIAVQHPGVVFSATEVKPGELVEATVVLSVTGVPADHIKECAGSLAVLGSLQPIEFETCFVSIPFGAAKEKVELLLQYRVPNEAISRTLTMSSLQIQLEGEEFPRSLIESSDLSAVSGVKIKSDAKPAPLFVKHAWLESAIGATPASVAYDEEFTLYLDIQSASPIAGGVLFFEVQSGAGPSWTEKMALPPSRGFAVVHKAGSSLLELELRVPKRFAPTTRLVFKQAHLWSEGFQDATLDLVPELEIDIAQ